MVTTDPWVIDLDRPETPEEPERQRPHGAIGHPRLAGIAVLTMVCVAALGGAARPPAPPIAQIGLVTWPYDWRDPTPPLLIAGLVMAEFDGEIFAYHPDGSLAWRSTPSAGSPEGVRRSTLWEWEGNVLQVQVIARGGEQPPQETVSVALDPATGKEIWRMRGAPERIGDLFLVRADPWEGSLGARVYRRLPDDLLWTAPPARAVVTDSATDTLMTLTGEGLLTEYELSTGKPRRTAQLWPSQPGQAVSEASLRLFRDRLSVHGTVATRDGPDTRSFGYDRATLRPAPPSPLDRFFEVWECGSVVCASGNGRASILDGSTLAELWRADHGELPIWTGFGMLLWPEPNRLVDERTGQDRVDLSGWVLAHGFRLSSEFRQAPHMMMTRTIGQTTYVARLTSRTVQVVAAIPQRLLDCEYYQGFLACTTNDGRTGVWRFDGGHR